MGLPIPLPTFIVGATDRRQSRISRRLLEAGLRGVNDLMTAIAAVCVRFVDLFPMVILSVGNGRVTRIGDDSAEAGIRLLTKTE